MTARTVKEWIGASPDAKIPPRVRLRVFDRHHGVCYLSGRKIAVGEPWDCDHIVALINGGQHIESNLAPALRDKHRAKTAEDVGEKSAVYEQRIRHAGIRKSRSGFQTNRDGRWKKRMDGRVERRT